MNPTNPKLRGRFAPTPSGEMHIGNAWTALLAWLQIRSGHGSFILRMEDIDKPRSKPHLARQILDDLRWLGIDWDEGPDVGGPYAPYTQSERLQHYEDALGKLQKQGALYTCFCSRADLLSAASAPHGLAAEGPAYPGTCRNLSPEERAAKAKLKQPSIRYRVGEEPVAFIDGVSGRHSFDPAATGDFIVKRADGMFSYQLAVVVDDAMMQVTHVLRGADLLDSTPRQIQLYQALGWEIPAFAHVPLFMGTDGKRLAKRHGNTSLAALREQGVSPAKLTGWLAWIGGLVPTPDPAAPQELIGRFDLSLIPAEPIVMTEDLLTRLYES